MDGVGLRIAGYDLHQVIGELRRGAVRSWFGKDFSYILSTSSMRAMYSSFSSAMVAVGTAIAGRPPHRSPRAVFPHEAPILDEWRQSELWGKDGVHAVAEANDLPDAASAPNSDDASGFDESTSSARAAPTDCGKHSGCRCFPVSRGS